jgi:hypothetical protein
MPGFGELALEITGVKLGVKLLYAFIYERKRKRRY